MQGLASHRYPLRAEDIQILRDGRAETMPAKLTVKNFQLLTHWCPKQTCATLSNPLRLTIFHDMPQKQFSAVFIE